MTRCLVYLVEVLALSAGGDRALVASLWLGATVQDLAVSKLVASFVGSQLIWIIWRAYRLLMEIVMWYGNRVPVGGCCRGPIRCLSVTGRWG